jgi:hypothetical protein
MDENEYANRDVAGKSTNAEPRPAKQLRSWHYYVLAVPFLGLLWPPLYARWTPEVFGMPFFYAYQFIWICLSSGLTALVYWSITR